MSAACRDATCVYCRAPLSARHEHDHMPVPERAGGTHTECACLNCHDLKDRVPLDRWTPAQAFTAVRGLWDKGTPTERIVIAKMTALIADCTCTTTPDRSHTTD